MAGIHVIAGRPKLVKWIELEQLQKVYDSISQKNRFMIKSTQLQKSFWLFGNSPYLFTFNFANFNI